MAGAIQTYDRIVDGTDMRRQAFRMVGSEDLMFAQMLARGHALFGMRWLNSLAFDTIHTIPSIPPLSVLTDPNSRIIFVLGSFASNPEGIVCSQQDDHVRGSFEENTLGVFLQSVWESMGVQGHVHVCLVDILDRMPTNWFRVYADDRVSEKPFHIDTRRTVSSRLTPAEVRFAKTLNPIPYTLHPRLSASVVEYGS